MTQAPMTPDYSTPPQQKPNTLALTSLVLGIASYLLCFIPYIQFVAWATAIGAIILGIMARNQVRAGQASGGGMATAGMILGIVWLVLGIVLLILALTVGLAIFNWAKEQQQLQQSGGGGADMLFRHAPRAAWELGRALLVR